jgi:hypothetical protein
MKILAYDIQSQNHYKSNLKRLDALSERLHTYCNSIIEITDKEAFFKSPTTYVINQFRIKSNLNVSDEKIISLYELPMGELNKLQNAYFTQKRSVPDTEPSFEIYARDKEHEATFKKLENLCESLNDLNAFTDTNAIQRSTRNAIKIDNGKWVPNPYYID